MGKGGSERIVYFDAKTKIHLQKYLESRNDNNPALFVSLRNLTIGWEFLVLKKECENLGWKQKSKDTSA